MSHPDAGDVLSVRDFQTALELLTRLSSKLGRFLSVAEVQRDRPNCFVDAASDCLEYMVSKLHLLTLLDEAVEVGWVLEELLVRALAE